MDIREFILARLAETKQPKWMTRLDVRTVYLHHVGGPPCPTLKTMAARWAAHPDYQDFTS